MKGRRKGYSRRELRGGGMRANVEGERGKRMYRRRLRQKKGELRR